MQHSVMYKAVKIIFTSLCNHAKAKPQVCIIHKKWEAVHWRCLVPKPDLFLLYHCTKIRRIIRMVTYRPQITACFIFRSSLIEKLDVLYMALSRDTNAIVYSIFICIQQIHLFTPARTVNHPLSMKAALRFFFCVNRTF